MNNNIFKNFSLNKLESISKSIKVEKFLDREGIIKQGEEGKLFYIVKSGKVDIFINDNYIRTLSENDSFGERALFFKETRSASAIANGLVELFSLDKDSFLSILESNMKEYLMNRLYLRDNTIELDNLNYIRPLGSGNYGLVSLVQSTKTNYFYAIKSIIKYKINRDQLHSNLELEKSILLQIDHPFIVKLVKTLKDQNNVYFLMEYVKGEELFQVIRNLGLLNKYQTQFYGASMMLAVKYLHERKFVYRDVKPENVMISESVNYSYNFYLGLY